MARILNVLNKRTLEYVGLVSVGADGKFLPIYNGMAFDRQPDLETAVRVIALASGRNEVDLAAQERPQRMTVRVEEGGDNA